MSDTNDKATEAEPLTVTAPTTEDTNIDKAATIDNASKEKLSRFDELKRAVTEQINTTYETTLKPTYDKVAPVAEEEWKLFKSSMAYHFKKDIKPAISDIYQDIAKPIIKVGLDVTFQELGHASSAIQNGYNNNVKPGLKYAYGNTLGLAINKATIPAERYFPETTAKIKDRLENGVTDPARTLRTGLAFAAATAAVSWRGILWTADALFTVIKAPYKGYRMYRDWEPKNEAVNKAKSVADIPFDALDFTVGSTVSITAKGYKGWKNLWKKPGYPVSALVVGGMGYYIADTTISSGMHYWHMAKDTAAEGHKPDIYSLEFAYTFFGPKIAKVLAYEPLKDNYKTTRDGFFASDLFQHNLRPAYYELIHPVVQEAREILDDVDDRTGKIAPMWVRAKDTFKPSETNREKNRQARKELVESFKPFAKRVALPTMGTTGTVALLDLFDKVPPIAVPFTLLATGAATYLNHTRIEKKKAKEGLSQNFEIANDNTDVVNDNAREAEEETNTSTPEKKSTDEPSI